MIGSPADKWENYIYNEFQHWCGFPVRAKGQRQNFAFNIKPS